MKTILFLQKKINRFYIQIIMLTIILLIYDISQTHAQEVLLNTISYVAVLLINIFFFYRKYYEKWEVYMILKIFTLISLGYISSLASGLIRFSFTLFLLMVIVELYIGVVNKNKALLKGLFSLIVATLGLICFIEISRGNGSFNVTIRSLIVLIFIYSFYLILKEFREDMMAKVKLQARLFKEAAKTNEELRLSQNEFKKIHNEIANQKMELLSANKKLNKMTAEIFTQNELLRYISSVLDIMELLEVVSDAMVGTIGVDTCAVILFDERNDEYLYSLKSNHPGDYLKELKEKVENGCLQTYFEDGKIHLNNRVVAKKYPFISGRPVGSLAIIPLLRDSLTYGLIIAEHTNIDMFTESNLQFFTGIATQITIAINNANMYALMEDMAIKDGLTGLYNRKYLQDNIEQYVKKADKDHSSLVVALFDIDKFKTVNDRYGHMFGDEAIKFTAATTLHIAKKYGGMAFRYGGEEFVLLLPQTSLEDASTIVAELHQNIKNEPLFHENIEVHINVSIGISSYPELASSGEKLLLRADNAMYYSKQHGRGNITIDSFNLEKVV